VLKTTFDSSGKPIISADWYEKHEELLASFKAEPVVLAEDSESAEVTADLVEAGGGRRTAITWGRR
jgi:hypothetical protein